MHSSLILVASRNDPSFDNAIITGSANFWLSGTPTTTEYDGSNGIQMTSQPKSHFECAFDFLPLIQR
jgi:hypothetical protein